MPVVTIDPSEYERKELKSAPADPDDPNDEQGYIMVRPLPYGKVLTLRDKSVRQRMMLKQPKKGEKAPDEAPVEFENESEWALNYEMSYCIGEHNLTDKNKQPIDLTNKFALSLLNPKVGAEIESILFELNRGEDEESLEDFLNRSDSSYAGEKNMRETDSPEPMPQV